MTDEKDKELGGKYPERAIKDRNQLFSMKDKFDKSVKEPEMEDVYAGPEYFENPSGNESELNEAPEPFEAVYAGPDFFDDNSRASKLKEVPMNRVYAGPGTMNKRRADKGRPSEKGGALLTKKEGRFCPGCGAPRKEGQTSCTECGTRFED